MLATAKSFSPWPPALSISTSKTLSKGGEDSSENKLNPMFASASSSEPSPTYSSEKQNFNSFVFDDVHCDATLESINLLAAKLLNIPDSNKSDENSCDKCQEDEVEKGSVPQVVAASSSDFSENCVQINIPISSSESRSALDSFKLATKLLNLPGSDHSDDKSDTCPEVEGEKEKGTTSGDATLSPDCSESDILISIPTTSRDSRSTPDDLVRSEKSEDTEDSDQNGQNARFKTEICRNFKERGHCLYGDLCQFAHGKDEMRNVSQHSKYKTKRCQKYWISGYCAYGPRCNFLHYEEISEVRPKPIPVNSRFRENSGGSGKEMNADSGYSTPNPSLSPPGIGVKLPTTPLFLDLLVRPTHGSGRLAALVKDGEWFWIDTITQKYV